MDTRYRLLIACFAATASCLSFQAEACAQTATQTLDGTPQAKKRVVVGSFARKGKVPQAKVDAVRKDIVNALKAMGQYDLVPDDEATLVGYGEDASVYTQTSDTLKAEAIIVGQVTVGKRWVLRLTVLNGGDGMLIDERDIEGKNQQALRKALKQEIAKNLPAALKLAEGKKRPKPLPPEPPPPPPPPPEEPEREHVSAIEAGIGLGLFKRDFSYVGSDPYVRDYHGFGPGFAFNARIYPGTFFTKGIGSQIGLSFGFAHYLGPAITFQGFSLGSSMTEWYLGLRGRYWLDLHELGIELRLGSQAFPLKGDEGPFGLPSNPPVPGERICDSNTNPALDPATGQVANPRVLEAGVSCLFPDVSYAYVEPMLTGNFVFDKLLLGGALGYRFVSSTGELEAPDWYPAASGGAIDISAYGGYALTPKINLIGSLQFTSYAFDFDPIPADRLDPTAPAPGPKPQSATDRYLYLWAGVSYTFEPASKKAPPPKREDDPFENLRGLDPNAPIPALEPEPPPPPPPPPPVAQPVPAPVPAQPAPGVTPVQPQPQPQPQPPPPTAPGAVPPAPQPPAQRKKDDFAGAEDVVLEDEPPK